MTGDLEFFQQAVKRICGTLEINAALENCFEFLQHFMPIHGLAMNIYDPEYRVVRNVALVTDLDESQLKRFGPVSLNREALDYIENLPLVSEPAVVLNHPKEQKVANLVWKAMGSPEISLLFLHPVLDGVKLGVVFMFTKGFNQYNPEHARLFTLLHDPFAIALSNTVKHRELLKIKERLADENRYLNSQLRKLADSEIIGRDLGLKNVMEMVGQAAPLSSHVLLVGETGVGKEVIANAIHYSSTRSDGPLIKVNCGAIPDNLVDSELFGHEQGAFTGAIKRKQGIFERADKGTVFLDEIGELPPHVQVRLLRVIQNREIERVGGSKSIKVDIRIIAATHRNLKEMVENGEFREDLWFRLNVFPIHIPPLRERLSDLPELVSYFINRKSREMNFRLPPVPAPGFLEMFRGYDWPGNVRELENVIERSLIRNFSAPPNTPLKFETFERPVFGNVKPSADDSREDYNLDNVIRDHINLVLDVTAGKVKGKNGAADLLGLNSSTLRNRMKKLGIPFGKKSRY